MHDASVRVHRHIPFQQIVEGEKGAVPGFSQGTSGGFGRGRDQATSHRRLQHVALPMGEQGKTTERG